MALLLTFLNTPVLFTERNKQVKHWSIVNNFQIKFSKLASTGSPWRDVEESFQMNILPQCLVYIFIISSISLFYIQIYFIRKPDLSKYQLLCV